MTAYSNILEKMQKKYTELSGIVPNEASDINIRLQVLAGQIETIYSNMESLEKTVFPQTSSGDSLDMHAQMRGLSRKFGSPAKGDLRFSREFAANVDISIPSGTTVASTGTAPIYYATSEDCILKSGNTYIDVEGVSLEQGITGNMGSGKISIIVNPVAGISRVTNITPFSGGGERESDNELRERIITSYASISNGTNAAYYQDISRAYAGVKFAKVLPRNRGRGTVDIVICGDTPANEPSIIKSLDSFINKQREIGVDTLVYCANIVNANLDISLNIKEGHSPDTVMENVKSETKMYLDGLDISERLRLSHLGSKILLVDGVEDYRIKSPANDIKVLNYQKIRSGKITISLGE